MKQDKVDVENFLIELLSDAGLRKVRKHDDSITCECPFHGNTSNFKTFRVSTTENSTGKFADYLFPFHCFSCHEGGDIYKLIAKLMDVSYKKAIKLFKKKVVLTPVSISRLNETMRDLTKISNEIGTAKDIVLPASSKHVKPMIEYLEKRRKRYHGVMDIQAMIKQYELYYCSGGTYSGRIIMPIRNELNEVVEFNNRSINEKAGLKALYGKGCDIHKYIHGINLAVGKKKLIMVEGSFDMFQTKSAIMLNNEFNREFGVGCNMGTTVSEERLLTIQRNFKEVYLLFDHDYAGWNLTKEYYFKLKDIMPVYACSRSYPEKKDPGKCKAVEIYEALKNPEEIKQYNEFENMWKMLKE